MGEVGGPGLWGGWVEGGVGGGVGVVVQTCVFFLAACIIQGRCLPPSFLPFFHRVTPAYQYICLATLSQFALTCRGTTHPHPLPPPTPHIPPTPPPASPSPSAHTQRKTETKKERGRYY